MLLDFGFSGYCLFEDLECELEVAPVKFGKNTECMLYKSSFARVIKKSDIKKVEAIYVIPDFLVAPITSGGEVGEVVYKIDGAVIGKASVFITEDIERLDFISLYFTFIKCALWG